MKTKCYCVYCPFHPSHLFQNNFKEILTGWELGDYIHEEHNEYGKEVDCLVPVSAAFNTLGTSPEDHDWRVTAYGDGCAETGVIGEGFHIFANCGKEEYKEV